MVKQEVMDGVQTSGSLLQTRRYVRALCPDAGQIVFAVLGVADLRCLPSVPIDVRSPVAPYDAYY